MAARVYDMPTYLGQTFYRAVAHAALAKELEMTAIDYKDWKVRGDYIKVTDGLRDLSVIGACRMSLEYDEINALGDESDSHAALYTYWCMSNSTSNKLDPIYLKPYIAMAKLLRDAGSIYTDHDAVQYTVALYITGKVTATVGNVQDQEDRVAAGFAQDVTIFAGAADKLGTSSLINKVRMIRSPSKVGGASARYARAADAIERLQYTGSSVSADKAMREKDFNEQEAKDYSLGFAYGAKHSGATEVYNFLGIYVLVFGKVMCMVDRANLDMLRSCLRFWSGASIYCDNYRIVGNLDQQVGNMSSALSSCIAYIGSHILNNGPSVTLAKNMKTCMAILLNDYHGKAETLDLKGDERSGALMIEAKGVSHCGFNWYNQIMSLKLSDREKMDIAYLFHGLPAPGIDAAAMFDAVKAKLDNSNEVKIHDHVDFMNYSKAFDLACALKKFKGNVIYKTVPDYDITDKKWYKSCIQGSVCLPSDDEMGKAWVEGHYDFDPIMDRWYMDAQDVTHVMPSIEFVRNPSRDRLLSNELLYAIKYAPFLGCKYTAEEVRGNMCKGKPTGDAVLDLAGKSENTKYGAKSRETYSACDTVREIISEYDRLSVKPMMLAKGGTLRVSDDKLSRRVGDMIEMMSPDYKKKVLIISLDVSGWSPNANREFLLSHHDYVAAMSKVPAGYSMKGLWDHLSIHISKRGIYKESECKTGTFQGFTGSMDTTLHQHMAFYCIRTAKRKGILTEDEAAMALVLIDDGVIVVPLSDGRDNSDSQDAADRFLDHVRKTYLSLGFKIDMVKTIYSTIKMNFLNRTYAEGSEILSPLKVFAKADREFTRKFISLHAQMDAMTNSYTSSVLRGADPIVSFYMSAYHILRLAMKSNHDVANAGSEKIIASYFAPRSFGGWGMNSIVAGLCKERYDPLAGFIAMYKEFLPLVTSPRAYDSHARSAQSVLSQKFRRPDAYALLQNPTSVRVEGVESAEGATYSALRKGLSKLGFGKSFAKLFEIAGNAAAEEDVFKILKLIRMDCALAEEIAAATPKAVTEAIISRAYKNEIVNLLMDRKSKSRLTDKISKLNAKSAMHVINLPYSHTGVSAHWATKDHVIVASDIREAYYAFLGISFVNHTKPDPLLSLAHMKTSASLSVKFIRPISAGSDKKSSTWGSKHAGYTSLYDGRYAGRAYRTVRTIGNFDLSTPEFKVKDTLKKIATRAMAICEHVHMNGGDGCAMWNLINCIWGGKVSDGIPISDLHLKEGSSIKRLGRAFSNRTHPIWAFPNTLGCIQIDSSAFQSFLDNHSTSVDLMSVITMVRTAAILDASLGSNFEEDRNYGFHPDALVSRTSVSYEVQDAKAYFDLLSAMSARVSKDTSDEWKIAIQNCVVHVLTDKADSKTGEMKSVFSGSSIVIKPTHKGILSAGSVADLIDRVEGIPITSGRNREKTKVRSDIHDIAPSRSVEDHYRATASMWGPVAGCIAACSTLANRLVIRNPSRGFFMAGWNNRGMLMAANSAFEVPDNAGREIYAIQKKYSPTMSVKDLQQVFPSISYDILYAVSSGIPDVSAGFYALIGAGRRPSSWAYRSTAIFDREHLRVCFSYASIRCFHVEMDSAANGHNEEQTYRHFMRHIYMALRNGISDEPDDLIKGIGVAIRRSVVTMLGKVADKRDPDSLSVSSKIDSRGSSFSIINFIMDCLESVSVKVNDNIIRKISECASDAICDVLIGPEIDISKEKKEVKLMEIASASFSEEDDSWLDAMYGNGVTMVETLDEASAVDVNAVDIARSQGLAAAKVAYENSDDGGKVGRILNEDEISLLESIKGTSEVVRSDEI